MAESRRVTTPASMTLLRLCCSSSVNVGIIRLILGAWIPAIADTRSSLFRYLSIVASNKVRIHRNE